MKQAIFSALLLITTIMLVNAQSTYSYYNGKKWEQISGNGKMVNMAPGVSAFSYLDISHLNAKVKVEAGHNSYELLVSIDENLQSFFRYKQEDGRLKLYFDLSGGKYSRWLSSNNTVITVRVPQLPELGNSGNANIEVSNLDQDQFTLVSSGNADIKLNGRVAYTDLKTTGNSDIDAGNLQSKRTLLSSSGNATIVVNAGDLIQTGMNGNNEVINLFGRNPDVIQKEEATPVELIRFKLRNNSVLPAKLSVISYRPDEKGNGTNAFYLLPYAAKAFDFPVGTKIFVASQQQVNTVMSGSSIAAEAPFLVVKRDDNNKTFDINQ